MVLKQAFTSKFPFQGTFLEPVSSLQRRPMHASLQCDNPPSHDSGTNTTLRSRRLHPTAGHHGTHLFLSCSSSQTSCFVLSWLSVLIFCSPASSCEKQLPFRFPSSGHTSCFVRTWHLPPRNTTLSIRSLQTGQHKPDEFCSRPGLLQL